MRLTIAKNLNTKSRKESKLNYLNDIPEVNNHQLIKKSSNDLSILAMKESVNRYTSNRCEFSDCFHHSLTESAPIVSNQK